jgi:CRISPR-associated endonuclease Csn1
MKLRLALDIGHSSIGWAVLTEKSQAPVPPDLLGCGVVLFEKDSALASQRRLHRQQRRHVRATRTRIRRLEVLLAHLGALPKEELAARHAPGSGHPAPWQLAARVLTGGGNKLLTWPELWAVLRWYAHNRGYEPWGQTDESDPESAEDTEKVERAKAEMASLGTDSMAETVCRWLGVDPNGPAKLSHESSKNLRQQKAAFPRDIVRAEVQSILAHHLGKLTGVTEDFIRVLMDDGRAVACPGLVLPRRYRGGLLFGRLQMRYDNRIISCCVHTAAARYAELCAKGLSVPDARLKAEREAKVPGKKSPEFLRYRWGMLLANLRMAFGDGKELRSLTRQERAALHELMFHEGRLTKTQLRAAVRALPGWQRDNFDNLFLHPDAERALILDPVQALIQGHTHLRAVWPTLPDRLQHRIRNRWWRVDPANGRPHSVTLAELREQLSHYGGDVGSFDAAMASALANPAKPKARSRKVGAPADPLTVPLSIAKALASLRGRAPYARPLLAKAFDEVMAGGDPKGKEGCLEETDAVKRYRETRPFDQQTNNHLLRHRLLILGRLLRDLVADPAYGAGDPKRFTGVTIEVNRELRDHSGLTAHDIAKDLGLRLKSHREAVAWLEEAGLQPNGSLIRKARVALDLDCRCPYTGELFEAVHLRDGQADLDHIIPRSMRPSDSLDSLAITFPAVNRWKGRRTAWQFIQECGGQAVPIEHLRATGESRQLAIMTPQRFKEFVAHLDIRGHDDDARRKRRRKEFLLMESFEEKDRDFTPGQLTQTSQLTRLARIALRRALPQLADHDLVALPGSVTGSVRKAWNLMECLATVNPAVLDAEAGKLRPKDEIRGITHLHHAVDAVTLGYASALLPNRGDLWRFLSSRKIPKDHWDDFRLLAPVEIDAEGRWRLRELLKHHPELDKRIRACLAERRVVQHVPADMKGVRLEQNTWRVEKIDRDRVHLRQKGPRNAKGIREVPKKRDEIETAKAFGLIHGRLHSVKGVRVLDGNFAVAVLRNPGVPDDQRIHIIRHNRVFHALNELKKMNGGSLPWLFRAGAIIDVPSGSRKGRWRVVSPKKSEAYGISLDLAALDGTKVAKGNAPVETLLKDGMRLLSANYAGSLK